MQSEEVTFSGDVDETAALRARISELERRLAHAQQPGVLTEQVPAVFWTTDRELRFTTTSGQALARFDSEPETAVGDMVMSRLGIDDPDGSPIREHRRALAGEHVSYEYEFRGRHFQCRVEPLRNEQGEITGTIGIALDITERVELESQLRHRIAIESLLTSISKHFVALRPEEIDSGIEHVLKLVGEFAHVDRAYVFEVCDNGKAVSNTHEWCAEGIASGIEACRYLPIEHVAWWMNQMSRLEPIHIPAVVEMPPEAEAVRELLEDQDVQSVIAVPLATGGKLLGFLGLDSVRERKSWSPEDTAVLGAIGEIIAGAIDRRNAGQALRESEAVNRSLFDANPDIIMRVSRGGLHLTCHAGTVASLWLHADALIGRTVREAHSEEFAEPCMAMIEEVLRTGEVGEFEYHERLERGGRYREVRIAPCGEEEVLVIVRDITRRKVAESELRERDRFLSSLISNLPGYVYRCRNDRDWTAEYVSDGIKETLGYTPDDITIKRVISVGERIHPDDQDRVWEEVQIALRKRQRFQIVYRLKSVSGDYRWVWEQGIGVYAPDGSVEAIEGFVADMTERKLSEESLARSHALLRLTLNEMDHRVRNNLAAIVALIDLTAKKHDSVSSFSESIKSRIQAMSTVHAALSRNRWAVTTLRDLIMAFMPEELDAELHLDGPDVHVPPRQSAAVGMIMHELFANSLKYGALRDPSGRLEVQWQLKGATEDAMLELLWRETCTTELDPPMAEGLGTKLIQGVVRSELRGRAALQYTPRGAEHRFTFRIEREAGEARSSAIQTIQPASDVPK